MTIAFWCYSLAAVLAVAVGGRYLALRAFMPYHEAAAGAAWDDLAPGLRVLTLALLHGVGGGFLAVGVAVGMLLVFPFRAGEIWTQWAIPIIGLTLGAPTLLGVHSIRTRTPARPPWAIAALAVSLFLAGAAATAAAHGF